MVNAPYIPLALSVLLSASYTRAFVGPSYHRPFSSFLAVASKEPEQQIQSDYQRSRGDGSTGGGGLPMPRSKEKDDAAGSSLKRPKVGAEMPMGRPSWFRVPAPSQAEDSRYAQVKESLKDLKLHTVCEEAQCPNIGECWNGGTGTIMLLGDTCTRGCMFCAVNTAATPPPPDPFEPFKVSSALMRYALQLYIRGLARKMYSSTITYPRRLQKLSLNGAWITLS